MAGTQILVVRIGSMGDIIHTLPAVATLKHSFPGSHVTWVVDPKWAVLLDGNPYVDRHVLLDRHSARGMIGTCRELWKCRYDFAVDFQGLVKSALVASLARPDRIFGFHQSQARERPAALFYSTKVRTSAMHIVDRNLEVAVATGASSILTTFPLPVGKPEGTLPREPFVLASPLAGWVGKQWPLEYYRSLARRLREELGMPLVVNGPPDADESLSRVPEAQAHTSTVAGLIYATRQAAAVVGIDSGPMHLAAALAKPGVAIFGPTCPERNGPYGNSITVLRSPSAATSYKRRAETDASMREITPEDVFEALKARLVCRSKPAASSA